MSAVITKYEIPYGRKVVIRMFRASAILRVEVVDDIPYIWVAEEPAFGKRVDRIIFSVATGEDAESIVGRKYIGSGRFMLSGAELHYFDGGEDR